MPQAASPAWDQFQNTLFGSGSGATNTPPRMAVVQNPVGSGLVIANINVLNDGGDQHTTVGTGRSVPLGGTECSAFKWLWLSKADFTQKGWCLIWQNQQIGSPIVAVLVDKASGQWAFRSRNGSDNGILKKLGLVQFGKWAYFATETKIAKAPGGLARIWFSHEGWPDVTKPPTYERKGHNTDQGREAHNTMGMYAQHTGTGQYKGYWLPYGRAATPQRAIALAKQAEALAGA